MNVCFDTNVVVSAVATRGICADLINVAIAEHRLIVGPTILGELRQVLLTKLRLPVAVATEYEALLRLHATMVSEAKQLNFPELDESDQKVLAEAVAGQADVLVTGDQDLLLIATRSPVRIMTPRGFWELLRAS